MANGNNNQPNLVAKPYWQGNLTQEGHTNIPVYRGNPFRAYKNNQVTSQAVPPVGSASPVANSAYTNPSEPNKYLNQLPN